MGAVMSAGVLVATGSQVAGAFLALAAEDGLRPDLEPTDVTPGVVGFAVTAIVVAGLIGLLLSMVVKLRKVNLGAEQPERQWATPAHDPARDDHRDDPRDDHRDASRDPAPRGGAPGADGTGTTTPRDPSDDPPDAHR